MVKEEYNRIYNTLEKKNDLETCVIIESKCDLNEECTFYSTFKIQTSTLEYAPLPTT